MTAPFDLVVVGAGPAGLATSIGAARVGMRVLLLERRRPPLDKACGEGLMPRAVMALSRLLGSPVRQGQEFFGIEYRAAGCIARARFPCGSPGRGIRRLALSELLLARAWREGVEVRFGVEALGLGKRGIRLRDEEIPARWIVGADGLRSRVRLWAGLEPAGAARRRGRVGFVRHLAHPFPGEHVQVWFGRRAELYWTPLGPQEVGLALLARPCGRGFDPLLRDRFDPELVGRVERGQALGRDLGSGPFGLRALAPTDGRRVALVGDAAGSLDPLTGMGLALAFEEAEALVDCLAGGRPLGDFARKSRRLRKVPERLTALLLAVVEHSPRFLPRLVRALALRPDHFGALLGALGEEPLRTGRPASPVLTPLLALAWAACGGLRAAK